MSGFQDYTRICCPSLLSLQNEASLYDAGDSQGDELSDTELMALDYLDRVDQRKDGKRQ